MVVNYNNCMISAKCTSRVDLGLVIEEEIGKKTRWQDDRFRYMHVL